MDGCGNAIEPVLISFKIFRWLGIPLGVIIAWLAWPYVNFNLGLNITSIVSSVQEPNLIFSIGLSLIILSLIAWFFHINTKEF